MPEKIWLIPTASDTAPPVLTTNSEAATLSSPAFSQSGEIRIAHVYSKTGPLEAYGKQTQTGLMMGLEYATGGTMAVGGKKIVVIDDGKVAARMFFVAYTKDGEDAKTIMLLFLDEGALKQFRGSEGWKAGVDGSVAVLAVGAGTSLDSTKLNNPIVGFILDQKGLMYNLTLEGSKFSKINK